jgi:ATP-dependent helicase YprA (DUF1998 family)
VKITAARLVLPPRVFSTVSLWFDIPVAVIESISRGGLDFAGGIHAAEHAAIGILPLFALCDRNDIGGVSTPFHPDTGTLKKGAVGLSLGAAIGELAVPVVYKLAKHLPRRWRKAIYREVPSTAHTSTDSPAENRRR